MTTFDDHRNLAVAVVSAGSTVIGSAAGPATLVAESDGAAALFPDAPFGVTVWRDAVPALPAAEIMRVTSFDGYRTFTAARAQEGTSALAGIAEGWRFANSITAGAIDAIEVALNAEESARSSADLALQTQLDALAEAIDGGAP